MQGEVRTIEGIQKAQFITPSMRGLLVVEPGMTGDAFMDRYVPHEWRSVSSLFIDGVEVLDPTGYTIQPSDNIAVLAIPQGGDMKQILGMVLMVVVAVAAFFIAPILAPMLGFAASGFAATAIQVGITLIGSLIVNALVTPSSLNTNNLGTDNKAANTYTFNGQSNAARHYRPILRVYGRMKVFPALASNPLIKNVGRTGTITALYDFGFGWVNYTDLQIGDTDADEFDPKLYVHKNSLGDNLVLNSRSVAYDQFAYVLSFNQPFSMTTKPDTIIADIDIAFQRGFFDVDVKTGVYRPVNVSFRVRWRPSAGGAWAIVGASRVIGMRAVTNTAITPGFLISYSFPNINVAVRAYDPTLSPNLIATDIARGGVIVWQIVNFDEAGYLAKYPNIRGSGWTGTGQAYFEKTGWRNTNPYNATGFTITGGSKTPISFTVSIPFPALGEYEIEVTRLTADSKTDGLVEEANLALVKSFSNGKVLELEQKHTLLEMQLTATDKISGVVQNLSAIATSVLPTTTDGTTFVWEETRNPAWIALDVLTGEATHPNKRLPHSLIDWPSWIHLANVCDSLVTITVNGVTTTRKKFCCDIVVDYATTVQELVNSILSSCRASMVMTTGGKYGVLIDEEQTTPRQLITPANSWSFNGNRIFADRPHALRVSYVNPEVNWQKDEVIVYDDGFNKSNATKFEELGTFGITSYSEAWSYGRYMIAQGIWRTETFSVTMDIENLILQRGDRVDVAHDVPQVGGFATRIISIAGNNVTIEPTLSVAPTGYSVRLSNGVIRTGAVVAVVDNNTFTLDTVNGMQPDDMIVLGLTTRVTDAYLVTRITPASDLTAELTMVQYVPAIYDADTGAIPDWNPGFGDDLVGRTNLKVTNLRVSQRLVYVERFPYVDVMLNWATTGFDLHHHIVSAALVGQKAPVEVGTPIGQQLTLRYNPLQDSEFFTDAVTFTVTPVNGSGMEGQSGIAQIDLLADTTPPEAPIGFKVDVGRINTVIDWLANPEPDIDHYEIRFAPKGTVASWAAGEFVANVGWAVNNYVEVGRKVGTFMIKAVDTSGNWSGVTYALPDNVSPGAPISFALNVDKERIQLFWITPADKDISHFSIRYSPIATLTPDWNASQLLMNVPHDATSVAVGARTGTYMIRTYDTSGNVSAMSFRRTTVELLPDINIVGTMDDAPTWSGAHVNTNDRGSSLVMSNPALTSAYYTYSDVFNLGDVYETKITSKIEGYGELDSDMMITWPNLLDINLPALSNAQSDQWNAWLEVRYTTAVTFIASWANLDSVVNMAAGSGEVWTPWRPVETGVFTGNVFQFRIQMRSYDGVTKPVVIAGLVEIDMPDRTFYLPDIVVPAVGQVILFDPPFRSVPVIAISIDGTLANLYYRLSNKSPQGVTVNLFDRATNAPALGKIDLQAKGYGRLRPAVV